MLGWDQKCCWKDSSYRWYRLLDVVQNSLVLEVCSIVIYHPDDIKSFLDLTVIYVPKVSLKFHELLVSAIRFDEQDGYTLKSYLAKLSSQLLTGVVV